MEGGPTVFADSPESAHAKIVLIYRARTLISMLMGREPTPDHLRPLLRPVAERVKRSWASQGASQEAAP
jgi:hypothetical protein